MMNGVWLLSFMTVGCRSFLWDVCHAVQHGVWLPRVFLQQATARWCGRAWPTPGSRTTGRGAAWRRTTAPWWPSSTQTYPRRRWAGPACPWWTEGTWYTNTNGDHVRPHGGPFIDPRRGHAATDLVCCLSWRCSVHSFGTWTQRRERSRVAYRKPAASSCYPRCSGGHCSAARFSGEPQSLNQTKSKRLRSSAVGLSVLCCCCRCCFLTSDGKKGRSKSNRKI